MSSVSSSSLEPEESSSLIPAPWYPGRNDQVVLSGRVAVLTGVTGGIGQAIMVALLHEGMTVCLIGRNRGAILEIIAQQPTDWQKRLFFYEADMLIPDQLRAACRHILDDHPRIDVVVSSAGREVEIAWDKITTELDELYQINVRAPFILLQELVGSLKETKGQVVFMNSSSVQYPGVHMTCYTTSKFALKGLADSFRIEFNPDGIRTLSVYPGRTATDMQRRLHKIRGEEFRPERLSQPEDIAGVVVHLLKMPRTSEVTEYFIRPAQNWKKG